MGAIEDKSTAENKTEAASSYKAILTAILLAIVSAALGYAVSLINEQRKDKIELANRQIEKLYGPLFALSTANRQAWNKLHHYYRGGETYYFSGDETLSAEKIEVWRRWMKFVLMPTNQKMEATIVEHAELLEGNEVPPLFLDFVAHVESYKATMASWKETDDLSEKKFRIAEANTALLNYPVGLDRYICQQYSLVLDRREQLKQSWTGVSVPQPRENYDQRCSNISP